MTEKQAITEFKDRLRISARNKYADLIPEYIEAMQLAISALENQDADRWIPVTESLPEYRVEVLAQFSGSFMDINWVIDEEDAEWFEDGVIAWRPLPEPYTEEES